MGHWSHISKGEKRNEEEPSEALPYLPRTFIGLADTGGGIPVVHVRK